MTSGESFTRNELRRPGYDRISGRCGREERRCERIANSFSGRSHTPPLRSEREGLRCFQVGGGEVGKVLQLRS